MRHPFGSSVMKAGMELASPLPKVRPRTIVPGMLTATPG